MSLLTPDIFCYRLDHFAPSLYSSHSKLPDCSSKSLIFFLPFFSVLITSNFGNHIINFQELFLVLWLFLFHISPFFYERTSLQVSLRLVSVCLRDHLFSKLLDPLGHPMYLYSSFSSMSVFLQCLVRFGRVFMFKNERQGWSLQADRKAFLNGCLLGMVPAWDPWVRLGPAKQQASPGCPVRDWEPPDARTRKHYLVELQAS